LKRRMDEKQKVRINCEIRGEPARIYLDLKRRGLIISARDAVVQGLTHLYEEILQRDLQEAKVKASRKFDEDTF